MNMYDWIFSRDRLRPITTAAACDATDLLPNRFQHKWLQVAICRIFSNNQKNIIVIGFLTLWQS